MIEDCVFVTVTSQNRNRHLTWGCAEKSAFIRSERSPISQYHEGRRQIGTGGTTSVSSADSFRGVHLDTRLLYTLIIKCTTKKANKAHTLKHKTTNNIERRLLLEILSNFARTGFIRIRSPPATASDTTMVNNALCNNALSLTHSHTNHKSETHAIIKVVLGNFRGVCIFKTHMDGR